jgi:hypothetical protein
MGREKKSRPSRVAKKKARDRACERTPWNKLDVQLALYFSPSLQARWGVPPVVYEPLDLIYPKLHAREENE